MVAHNSTHCDYRHPDQLQKLSGCLPTMERRNVYGKNAHACNQQKGKNPTCKRMRTLKKKRAITQPGLPRCKVAFLHLRSVFRLSTLRFATIGVYRVILGGRAILSCNGIKLGFRKRGTGLEIHRWRFQANICIQAGGEGEMVASVKA